MVIGCMVIWLFSCMDGYMLIKGMRSMKYLILIHLHHLLFEIKVSNQERVFLIQQILKFTPEIVHFAGF